MRTVLWQKGNIFRTNGSVEKLQFFHPRSIHQLHQFLLFSCTGKAIHLTVFSENCVLSNIASFYSDLFIIVQPFIINFELLVIVLKKF